MPKDSNGLLRRRIYIFLKAHPGTVPPWISIILTLHSELPVVTKGKILHRGFCKVSGCCAVGAKISCFIPDCFSLIGAEGLHSSQGKQILFFRKTESSEEFFKVNATLFHWNSFMLVYPLVFTKSLATLNLKPTSNYTLESSSINSN